MANPVPFNFRATAILRGVDPKHVIDRGRRAWDAGFDLVEVPVQDRASLHALEVLAGARDAGAVGAGTVCSPAELRGAADVGAEAFVTPGFSPKVSETAWELGFPLLPGVFSPSEVMAARAAGHRTVKLFPAGTLGPAHVKALRGPFPDVRFVVVGGVGPAVLPEYVASGAWGVGVGGDLEEFLAAPQILDDLHASC